LCHDCAIPKEVTDMVNQYLNQRTIKELVHSSESVFQAMTVPSGYNLILYLTSFIDKDVKTSDLSFLEVGGGKCQLSLCASYVFKRIVAIEISKNITDVVRNCFKELNLFRLVLMNEDVLQIRSFYGKINYNQYIQ
jgi:predicted RNA methylase